MRAVLHELLVDRMHLVRVLPLDVVEEQQLGSAVTVVDHFAFFGGGRDADMQPTHGLDLLEGANAGEQRFQIFLRLRILEPKEDMVNQLGKAVWAGDGGGGTVG